VVFTRVRHLKTVLLRPEHKRRTAVQRQQHEEIQVSLPNDGDRTQNNRKVKVVDLPVWVEFKGDTRAAEDPADCMRRLDFEFIFLLGWWVADCDQQFVAGDSWRRGVTNDWCDLHFERGLGFRLYTGIC
jgi:hypothetical protein